MKFFSIDHAFALALVAIFASIWWNDFRPIDFVLLYGVAIANVRSQLLERLVDNLLPKKG